jgi:hypothetical protein
MSLRWRNLKIIIRTVFDSSYSNLHAQYLGFICDFVNVSRTCLGYKQIINMNKIL